MIDYRYCFDHIMSNQTGTGVCTAVALCMLIYFNMRMSGVRPFLVSPLFLYYNTRSVIMGTTGEDSGSEDLAALSALTEIGVCPESLWPFDTDCIHTRPSPECYEYAHRHPLRTRYRRLNTVHDIIDGLSEQRIAWCVMDHYSVQSVDPATNTLMTDFSSAKIDTTHSLLVVGATDDDHLIILNSYGQEGGSSGFFRVSTHDFERLVSVAYHVDTDMTGMDRTHDHMLRSSYDLVRAMTGSVDESHNHRHSEEVLFWSNEIMRRRVDTKELSRWEIEMIGHCCILHDLLDQKYDLPGAEGAVATHLRRLGFTHEMTKIMIDIMTSMSYHKTVHRTGVSFPEWINDGYWHVYHIVRESDLLASFNLSRMIEFGRHRRGITDPDILSDHAITMFLDRMDTLIEKGAFILSTEIAQSLRLICRMRLPILRRAVRNDHPDILRIVNYLDIDELIQQQMSLSE